MTRFRFRTENLNAELSAQGKGKRVEIEIVVRKPGGKWTIRTAISKKDALRISEGLYRASHRGDS